jgi:hypothetical protein
MAFTGPHRETLDLFLKINNEIKHLNMTADLIGNLPSQSKLDAISKKHGEKFPPAATDSSLLTIFETKWAILKTLTEQARGMFNNLDRLPQCRTSVEIPVDGTPWPSYAHALLDIADAVCCEVELLRFPKLKQSKQRLLLKTSYTTIIADEIPYEFRAAAGFNPAEALTGDSHETPTQMPLKSIGAVSQGAFVYNGMTFDGIEPAPWRLLELMCKHTEYDVEEAYQYAIRDDKKDCTENAINTMIRKANRALEAVQHPQRLSKPKNVSRIIWG